MLTPTPDRLARRRSSDKLAASSAAATPQLANLRMALFENETPSEGVMDEPMPEAIQEALSDELLEMQVRDLNGVLWTMSICLCCNITNMCCVLQSGRGFPPL